MENDELASDYGTKYLRQRSLKCSTCQYWTRNNDSPSKILYTSSIALNGPQRPCSWRTCEKCGLEDGCKHGGSIRSTTTSERPMDAIALKIIATFKKLIVSPSRHSFAEIRPHVCTQAFAHLWDQPFSITYANPPLIPYLASTYSLTTFIGDLFSDF